MYKPTHCRSKKFKCVKECVREVALKRERESRFEREMSYERGRFERGEKNTCTEKLEAESDEPDMMVPVEKNDGTLLHDKPNSIQQLKILAHSENPQRPIRPSISHLQNTCYVSIALGGGTPAIQTTHIGFLLLYDRYFDTSKCKAHVVGGIENR